MIGNRRTSAAVTYHVSPTQRVCTPSPTQRLIAVVILSILSIMFMLLLDDGSNSTDVSYDDSSGIYRQLQNDEVPGPSLLRQVDEEDDVTDREEEYVEAEVEDTSEEQRHDSDEISDEQHVDGSSKAESEEGEEDEALDDEEDER